jgi:hypothetical protein
VIAKLFYLVLSFTLLALPALVLAEEPWTQFRGPDGRGLSDASDLPIRWSEQKNIRWKAGIHGRAWSSPVILDQQIWLTTATEDGRELFAVCVDQESGKIIHDLKLFEVEKPQFAHKLIPTVLRPPLLSRAGFILLSVRRALRVWIRKPGAFYGSAGILCATISGARDHRPSWLDHT